MSRRSLLGQALLCVTLLLGGSQALAQSQGDGRFPSSDPDVRVGTPNDPRFDCAESDDEDGGDCASVFDEQWQLFGFAPEQSALTATYKDAARFGQGQISGVRADAAWKLTTGDPRVVIAVTDTGIDWNDTDLRRKLFLNAAELPVPAGASTHDRDGDGAVTVDDWIGDPRVTDVNGNELLDGQDLLAAFSDGVDDDGNGYVDDISGWDWLNDDNDPSDTSSVSSARRHGTGRLEEAGQETNEGTGKAGVCPDCRVLALKVWDSFVVPGDNWAEATVYTADIGASVQVVANGVLGNTQTMRLANRYAHESGVSLMHVSSDLNTANHNYPTNYRESVYINGCVSDVEGLAQGNEISGGLGLPLNDQPIQTWFRQAGLTQFGAHAHVCYMGATGSQATGQAGGGAGLIISRGLQVADQIGGPLTAGEVKQILTLTAEDVLPENTIGVGTPDPAQVGWDEHFGYGRADLGRAVAMVAPGTIPPDVLLHDPAWWHLLDPTKGDVPVTGRISADRSSGWSYELEWAAGVEPANDGFTSFGSGDGTSVREGTLGVIPMADVAAAIPGAAEGDPPTDPDQYVFTVRIRVTDAEGNVGEDRRTYFAFHDPAQPDGWPRFTNTGGESSQVLWDLDGDGTLEILEADSSGFVSVVGYDGKDVAFWNGGSPKRLAAPWFHHPDAPGFRSGAVPSPGTQGRTPIVADIDGDLEPEIVVAATTGEIHVWDRFGNERPGFPVSVDTALSVEAVQSQDNHVKRGFLANPSAGDLDGDGTLEIVAAALDGHLYVWEHDGTLRPGFPRKVADPNEEFSGGELITTPALGDLDGDGDLEITLISNEVYGAVTPEFPTSPGDLQSEVGKLVTNILANAVGGAGRAYAFEDDGALVDGWPVAVNGLLPDILPLVGPAHQTVLVDTDGDGDDEVVFSITTGDVQVRDGDGSQVLTFPAEGRVGNNTDPTRIFNLFEYLAVGDVDGIAGPDITKLGLTTNGVVNLLAAGQNLPFDYVVQAWDSQTGQSLVGFPASHDDFGLLSSPIVADVSGDGANEIIAGSGLYLVRAFDAFGQQAEGFPKLTGGWAYAVPTVGDVDGDGDLELLISTREGWSHLWDLDAATTPSGSNQWWGDGHDERHSLRYGNDTRPPAKVQNLAADGDQITFAPSGDDWKVGEATTYELRLSPTHVPTGGWGAITPTVSAEAPPLSASIPAGTAQVSVVAVDDAGNRSQPAVLDLTPAPAPLPPTPPAPLPATGGGLAILGLALIGAARSATRRR